MPHARDILKKTGAWERGLKMKSFKEYVKEQKLLDELSMGQKPTEALLKRIEKSVQEFKKGFS